ncbi:hypothetical protein NDU88_005504 [Pleurodeles waltl]|uniref:Uncharacterized protein n=1 Tax=Pleurodeles waltl TaxID=8319 RepID=A0AAV7L0Z7_PLEWA|nr:hypothetical protein NDU88_005504 [Pleurodeles waltl]
MSASTLLEGSEGGLCGVRHVIRGSKLSPRQATSCSILLQVCVLVHQQERNFRQAAGTALHGGQQRVAAVWRCSSPEWLRRTSRPRRERLVFPQLLMRKYRWCDSVWQSGTLKCAHVLGAGE